MTSWHGHTFRITGRLRKKSIDELQRTNGLYACISKPVSITLLLQIQIRITAQKMLTYHGRISARGVSLMRANHLGIWKRAFKRYGARQHQCTEGTTPLPDPMSVYHQWGPEDNFIRDTSAINFQHQIENYTSQYLLFHSHLAGTSELKPSRDVYVCWLTKLSLFFMMARCHKHDLNQCWLIDELPYNSTPWKFSQHQNAWFGDIRLNLFKRPGHVNMYCGPLWDIFLQNTHNRHPILGDI